MKSKQFIIDEWLNVLVSKRASSRRIRLTIASDGQVKVSIPKWLPYSAGVEFARSKTEWIRKKTPEPITLRSGRQVGKSHHLVFKPTDKNTVTTRLNDLEAVVFYPSSLKVSDPKVQVAAKRIIKRALLKQASKLLPIRLEQLAKKYGYSYSDIRIKSLKTRWGSCDSHRNITLNLYLMELPWELIDYVILHELNHTVVMAHGPKFWDALKAKLPNCLELKKQLKVYPTLV